MALTTERLRQVLTYAPETGLFYWRVSNSNRIQIGSIAGTMNAYRYRVIGIDGIRYHATHLATLWMTGEWPEEVDHKDNDPGNDRWDNLRPCSHAQNMKNMSKHADNSSGHKGVYTSTKGRTWFAQIMSDGKQKYLGSFGTKEQAMSAYNEAARLHHGDFARLNEVA